MSIGLDDARSARLVDAGDRDIVGSLKLDVVIDLTPESGPCAVAAASRRGFASGAELGGYGSPGHLFPVSGSACRRLLLHRPGGDAIDPDGELVYRNHDAVQLSIHAARHFRQLDRASVLCLARALRLLRAGDLPLAASSRSGDPRFDGEPSGLWQSLRHVGVCVLGNVEARRNRLAWQRGVGRRPTICRVFPATASATTRSVSSNCPMREAADPFIVSHEAAAGVLRAGSSGQRGAVNSPARGWMPMDTCGRCARSCAGPTIFPIRMSSRSMGGEWMIPETGEASKVDLYRAEQFTIGGSMSGPCSKAS
ncbi:MAG: hypothetical protein R3D03_07855 [Geminicoccaceae bacterium]